MSIQSEDIRFGMDLGRKCANKTAFSFLMYAHGHQKKLGVKGHQPLNHQSSITKP